MLLDRFRLSKPGACAVLCCAASSLWAPATALAQAAAAASAPAAEMTPAERAQRDADKVFKWILIHSDKPRKAAPAAPAATAARDDKPAVVTVRAKPAAPAAPAARAAEPASANTAAASTAADPRAAAAQPTSPSIVDAAPAAVTTAAARPGAESLALAANLPGPLQSATSTPAAVAAEALEETLTPLSRAAPQFPPNLLRTLRKGQVQVRFTVLPDGSVSEPSVLASSNARLNQAALAAVAQWRFAPLQRAQGGRVDLGFDLD